MRIGMKSLLFGCHQFIWHPVTVNLAWIKLYKRLPTFKEQVCIWVHDWGYWDCTTIDGEDGKKHPYYGAQLVHKWLDEKNEFKWSYFCLLHSRSIARQRDMVPSALCWADKLSILYDPSWFYLLRTHLSGEIKEFRQQANDSGFCSWQESDWEWIKRIKRYMRKQAYTKTWDKTLAL
jgi:hypothetical protein